MKLLLTIILILNLLKPLVSGQIDCHNIAFIGDEELDDYRLHINDYINHTGDSLIIVSMEIFCHAQRSSKRELEAYALNFIGLHHYQKQEFSQALEHLLRANNLIKELAISGFSHLQNENFLGLVYHRIEEYALAIEHSVAFYDYATKINDIEETYNAANTLGLLYRDIGELDKSRGFLEIAKRGFSELQDNYGYGYAILNLSLVERALKHDHLATNLLEELIPLWEDLDYKEGLYWAYLTAAGYHLQSDLAETKYYVDKTEEIVALLNKTNPIEFIKLNGDFSYQKKEYENAETFYKQTLNLLAEVPDFKMYQDVISSLNHIYQLENNYAAMIDLNEDVISNMTSMVKKENDMKVEFMEMQQNAALSKRDIALQKEAGRTRLYFIALLFVSALSLGLLLLTAASKNKVLKANNKKLEELNDSVEFQNRKIMEKNDVILQQNKVMEGFVDKKVLLLSHHKELLNTITKTLDKIENQDTHTKRIKEIVRTGLRDNIWTDLDYFLDYKNRSFTANLLQVHGRLTNKEIQLATLLRLNLDSKEIANLLFVNPSSVKVARSRLRKKLGIRDTKVTLFGYLNQFS